MWAKAIVVRDAAIHHQRVCDEVSAWLEETGWRPSGITESPIKGPKGNIEFLHSHSEIPIDPCFAGTRCTTQHISLLHHCTGLSRANW